MMMIIMEAVITIMLILLIMTGTTIVIGEWTILKWILDRMVWSGLVGYGSR
jgi:hypothetical protein